VIVVGALFFVVRRRFGEGIGAGCTPSPPTAASLAVSTGSPGGSGSVGGPGAAAVGTTGCWAGGVRLAAIARASSSVIGRASTRDAGSETGGAAATGV
jgi:hypothetical protein